MISHNILTPELSELSILGPIAYSYKVFGGLRKKIFFPASWVSEDYKSCSHINCYAIIIQLQPLNQINQRNTFEHNNSE